MNVSKNVSKPSVFSESKVACARDDMGAEEEEKDTKDRDGVELSGGQDSTYR